MIKKTLPLAVYYCPLPECTQNFGSLEMFMQHVRCGHSVQELRKFGVPSLSGVEWIGNARYVHTLPYTFAFRYTCIWQPPILRHPATESG
jgi:hypothetical protein